MQKTTRRTKIAEKLLLQAFLELGSSDKALFQELFKAAKPATQKILGNLRKYLIGEFSDVLIDALAEFSIVLAKGRPVFSIQDSNFNPNFADGTEHECEFWRKKFESSKNYLTDAIPSVGRVAVKGHPTYDWVGTGWLTKDNIIVTNRHVALAFAERSGSGFVFRVGTQPESNIEASIDFHEEYGHLATAEFPVREILWIEPGRGPDLAFLRLDDRNLKMPLPKPIHLSDELVSSGEFVATIGYPARDSRIPDQELVLQIFGDIYNKKRLAPGKIRQATSDRGIQHDCSTLGGNSGSVLLSMSTGQAVGLHYAGRYLRANYAVSSKVVEQRRREVVSGEATAHLLSKSAQKSTEIGTQGQSTLTPTKALQGQVGNPWEGGTTWTIPLEVTVRVGEATVCHQQTQSRFVHSSPPSPDDLQIALKAAEDIKAKRTDVSDVRTGYRFRNGWITDERVIVFSVRRKLSLDQLSEAGLTPLPKQIMGVGVDVMTESPLRLLGLDEFESEWWTEAVRGKGHYEKPPKLALTRVVERMDAIIHVSPDAGYAQLSQFLDRVERSLTLGMYEFNADYIFEKLRDIFRKSRCTLNMVVQRFENNASRKHEILIGEIVDALRKLLPRRFNHAWAAVRGTNRLFANAYHIKVAVRDREEFWLSSGNWKPSGQPADVPIGGGDRFSQILRSNNREWHVLIKNENLARQFEDFILYDLEQAKGLEAAPIKVPEILIPESVLEAALEREVPTPRWFMPLTLKNEQLDVQPLLTPDNYTEHVLELVESAEKYLYFQNQSLSPLVENEPGFESLLNSLKRKQSDGLDVRIIFRDTSVYGGTAAVRESIEKLKHFGFDIRQVKVQRGCHTKGIIVDGATALLGSHNWTNAGTLYNRDASLIFRNRKIAHYLENIFLFDWNNVAKQQLDEAQAPLEFDSNLESGEDMVQVPLTELLG